jgi:hypothetical protein
LHLDARLELTVQIVRHEARRSPVKGKRRSRHPLAPQWQQALESALFLEPIQLNNVFASIAGLYGPENIAKHF